LQFGVDVSAFFAGVDVGSVYAKAVVVDGGGVPLARAILPTGLDLAGTGAAALARACADAGVAQESLCGTLGTGYGRDDVSASHGTRSEVLCLATGAFALRPQAMTLVDIGGQDSKAVFLDGEGRRTDYRMNRRCAAGTGSFLEIICLRMGVPLADLCAMAERTRECAPLGSFCSVFAATEVLDLLRRGHTAEAIARGAYRSVAQRVAEMGLGGERLFLSGGVAAHHPVLAGLVEEVTGIPTETLPDPQHVGAFGAALLARRAAEGLPARGDGPSEEAP
jgi:predicted CoA-substrate-specific enzyme activase